jgi:dnd system-associated protein 4
MKMSEKVSNWRTLPVKRDRRFESLILQMSEGGVSIFQNFKDIMVFAAMVGYSDNSRRTLESKDTVSIILDTYETDNKDTFIYLLALITNKNAECLKDENLMDSIKIFEEYCNSGLYIIEAWRDESPVETMVDIILKNIYDQIASVQLDVNSVDNSNLALPTEI